MPAFGLIHRSKSETQGQLSRRGGGTCSAFGLLFLGSRDNVDSGLITIRPVPEIIDPVFAKTSQNARFLLSENERFGLVFVKTGSINSGTDISLPNHGISYLQTLIDDTPCSGVAEQLHLQDLSG